MKLIKKHNNKKGFTLVELVIVIAILAVLALILVPAISGYVDKSNTAKDQASARAIYTNAILAHSTEEGDANVVSTTADLSNTDTSHINIYVKDNQIAYIAYYPDGDSDAADAYTVTFDGKSFEDIVEGATVLEK